MNKASIPSPPFHYLSPTNVNDTPNGGTTSPIDDPNVKSIKSKICRSNGPSIDLSELDAEVLASEESKRDAYDLGSDLKVALVQARELLERPHTQAEYEKVHSHVKTIVHSILHRKPLEKNSKTISITKTVRESNLSFRLQEYASYESYTYFLQTGTLLPPSNPSVSSLTDEEYLGGAVIGIAPLLARYAIGRATLRDVRSVYITRDLLRQLEGFLMTFDFRNGPLRRRYDGVKYNVKAVETLSYELSVTGANLDTMDVDEEKEQPNMKRMKNDDDNDNLNTSTKTNPPSQPSVLPIQKLEELRSRMERRDELRESLIKQCRDAQKFAKQAIYAIHRNDNTRATKLLQDCLTIIQNNLQPIVNSEPSLYYGSFSNVLEEYVEAVLFHSWIYMKNDGMESTNNQDNNTTTNSTGLVGGKILSRSEFSISLHPEDYLGGLCDLTGEIGRYAVKRGTLRDSASVTLCLQTNMAILLAMERLNRFPSGCGVGKKMEPLRRSVEKIEKMLYELSLVEATGRKDIKAESTSMMDGGVLGGINDED